MRVAKDVLVQTQAEVDWDSRVYASPIGGILERRENSIDYERYFVKDPKICGGETVIRGTRVTLRTVLASLREGATAAEIVQDFPTVTETDVRAVIAFAAASAQEDIPLRPLPELSLRNAA